MKRRTRSTTGNPFLAWGELAWRGLEMSLASGEVIAHRTARMAAAGPLPGARDRREFTLMGQEKMEAATESATAIGTHLMRMNLEFGSKLARLMLANTAALMSVATSRNAGQLMARQAEFARTVTRSMTTAAALSDSTARLVGHGMAPVHARATANARRLRRG